MVSAQNDELLFYFKLSEGSITNRSINRQTSGHISPPLSYLRYVVFHDGVKHLRFGWLRWRKDINHNLITGKLQLKSFAIKDGSNFQNVCISLQFKLTLTLSSLSPSLCFSLFLSLSLRHIRKHRQAVTHSIKEWVDFRGYRAWQCDWSWWKQWPYLVKFLLNDSVTL